MTLWDLYKRFVFDLYPVTDDMYKTGVSVDRLKQEALKERITKELDGLDYEAQPLVPNELKPVLKFKSQRPDTIPIEVPGIAQICSKCGQVASNKSKHLKGGKKNACHGATFEKRTWMVYEYHKTLPFKLTSTQQLMAYARFFKHPVGTNIKTKQPSMDRKHLDKLVKKYGGKHKIYAMAARAKGIQRALSTYVIGFQSDTGIITGFYKNTPETLRFAQSDKNLMNVSHRGNVPYAEEIRRTIVAREGNIFVEADSSSIEAVFLGYYAGDEGYIELAKKGIHAYLCCMELGIPFTPENVKMVKNSPEHSLLYERKKMTAHMSGYAGGPAMLQKQHPTIFPSIVDAKREQEFFLKMCPAVPRFWRKVTEMAQKQSYLKNAYGFSNYFYNVYRQHPNHPDKVVKGEDYHDAIAFLPQSTAAMFARDNLRQLFTQFPGCMPANGFNHDGYILEVPGVRKDEAIEALKTCLSRPIPELQGLVVDCEVKIGYNWGSHSTENPDGMREVV